MYSNVDLYRSSAQVNFILDEIIMGGMVLETNINEIINATDAMREREVINPLRLGQL